MKNISHSILVVLGTFSIFAQAMQEETNSILDLHNKLLTLHSAKNANLLTNISYMINVLELLIPQTIGLHNAYTTPKVRHRIWLDLQFYLHQIELCKVATIENIQEIYGAFLYNNTVYVTQIYAFNQTIGTGLEPEELKYIYTNSASKFDNIKITYIQINNQLTQQEVCILEKLAIVIPSLKGKILLMLHMNMKERELISSGVQLDSKCVTLQYELAHKTFDEMIREQPPYFVMLYIARLRVHLAHENLKIGYIVLTLEYLTSALTLYQAFGNNWDRTTLFINQEIQNIKDLHPEYSKLLEGFTLYDLKKEYSGLSDYYQALRAKLLLTGFPHI